MFHFSTAIASVPVARLGLIAIKELIASDIVIIRAGNGGLANPLVKVVAARVASSLLSKGKEPLILRCHALQNLWYVPRVRSGR